jgi:hypothetical protein
MFELKFDVLVVIPERRARQTFHVLKDEGLRLTLPNRSDGLWKHVTCVGMGAMLASNREWLAGRSAGHELYLAGILPKVDIADIAVNEGPIHDRWKIALLVLPDRVAAIRIPLDDTSGPKACLVKTNSKPSSPRENFYRLHSRNALSLPTNASSSRSSHSQTTSTSQP